jgi:hypothetical protein
VQNAKLPIKCSLALHSNHNHINEQALFNSGIQNLETNKVHFKYSCFLLHCGA